MLWVSFLFMYEVNDMLMEIVKKENKRAYTAMMSTYIETKKKANYRWDFPFESNEEVMNALSSLSVRTVIDGIGGLENIKQHWRVGTKTFEYIQNAYESDEDGVTNDFEICKNAFENVARMSMWDVKKNSSPDDHLKYIGSPDDVLEIHIKWWYPYMTFDEDMLQKAIAYANTKNDKRSYNLNLRLEKITSDGQIAVLLVDFPNTISESFSRVFASMREFYCMICGDHEYYANRKVNHSLWQYKYTTRQIHKPSKEDIAAREVLAKIAGTNPLLHAVKNRIPSIPKVDRNAVIKRLIDMLNDETAEETFRTIDWYLDHNNGGESK